MLKMSPLFSQKPSNHRLRVSIMALVIGLSPLMAPSVMAESLTDAIRMAYQQNPSIQRQRALQRATDETYVQAKSGLGPDLSLSGTTNYSNYNQGSSLNPNRSNTSVSLNASQTLFGSGALNANIASAQANVKASQQELRSAEQGLLFDVISIYTAVRRDQEALKIAQSSLNIFQKQFEETQARFQVGELTRTDVAQAEASVASARSTLALRQAQLDSDRAIYVAIIGQMPTNLDEVPLLNSVPASFDQALEAGESGNPALKSALFAEEAARQKIKAARAQYGPKVSLGASYGGSQPTRDLGSLSVNAAVANLSVTVPLFSSGAISSSVRQASEGHNAQVLSVEVARRQVIQSVSQAWSNLVSSNAAITANTLQVKAAGVAAEGVRYEAQAGLRTTIEVLNAQLAYDNAQLALIEAKRNQYLAQTQLLLATGSLEATDFDSAIPVYDPQTNFDKVRKKGGLPWSGAIEAGDKALGTVFTGGDKATKP